jgi:hypothetical protein
LTLFIAAPQGYAQSQQGTDHPGYGYGMGPGMMGFRMERGMMGGYGYAMMLWMMRGYGMGTGYGWLYGWFQNHVEKRHEKKEKKE